MSRPFPPWGTTWYYLRAVAAEDQAGREDREEVSRPENDRTADEQPPDTLLLGPHDRARYRSRERHENTSSSQGWRGPVGRIDPDGSIDFAYVYQYPADAGRANRVLIDVLLDATW